MSSQPGELPVDSAAAVPVSEEFVAYCEAEFERRLNSGAEFDEAGYREAMEMALLKLRILEEEGGE